MLAVPGDLASVRLIDFGLARETDRVSASTRMFPYPASASTHLPALVQTLLRCLPCAHAHRTDFSTLSLHFAVPAPL